MSQDPIRRRQDDSETPRRNGSPDGQPDDGQLVPGVSATEAPLSPPPITAEPGPGQDPGRISLLVRCRALIASPAWRRRGLTATEIGLLILWALWVGRDYLNLSPLVWPQGREFGMAIQANFIWTLLGRCGDCVLWNGFVNGGAPSLVELHGAPLHPLVIVATLLWGGLNGAKLVLIASLAMAGLAQWWLARVMGLGWLARLWAGAMAVVGGHLAGRMEIGVFAVVLSTAAASLVLAPALDLALTGRRRSAVLLAVTLAMALVSGQGYLQVGLIVGILPALGILLIDERLRIRPVWREFLLAGGLALLLTGLFWLPLLHFWPNFAKDIDPNFTGTQTLGNTMLNLVIRDLDVYFQRTLGTNPYPYQYVTYIGWIPVLLALLSLRLVPRRQTRLLVFFFSALFLVFLLASGGPLRLLQRANPNLAAAFRNPSLVAGLTVPLILGLAGWSVDRLARINWPMLIFTRDLDQLQEPRIAIRLSWIVLALVLLAGLQAAYTFSRGWLQTILVPGSTLRVVEALETADSQWVQFPFGEHFWTPSALDRGYKIAHIVRPWGWAGRESPPYSLRAERELVAPSDPRYRVEIDGVFVTDYRENSYATIQAGENQYPCTARSRGGHIDVSCQSPESGLLLVRENSWSGWTVRRNGAWEALGPGPWLTVEAPAGAHQFRFRYRPWDAVAGLGLTLIGLFGCVWIWFFRPAAQLNPAPVVPPVNS